MRHLIRLEDFQNTRGVSYSSKKPQQRRKTSLQSLIYIINIVIIPPLAACRFDGETGVDNNDD